MSFAFEKLVEVVPVFWLRSTVIESLGPGGLFGLSY